MLGLGVGVVHVALDPAEERLRAEHVDRHLGRVGDVDRLLEPVLVVAHLVGHDDDHRAGRRVPGRPCSGPTGGRSRRRSGTWSRRPVVSSGTASMALTIASACRRSARGSSPCGPGRRRRPWSAGRRRPARLVLVELRRCGCRPSRCACSAARRSAWRLPEASNAQTTRVRPCSSRRRISSAIRSTAPSTPPTCSAPLPLIETVWPSIEAVGTATSVVARRTSSVASSTDALRLAPRPGRPPPRRRDDRDRRDVRRERAGGGRQRRAARALWSRSWNGKAARSGSRNVESTTRAWNSRWISAPAL